MNLWQDNIFEKDVLWNTIILIQPINLVLRYSYSYAILKTGCFFRLKAVNPLQPNLLQIWLLKLVLTVFLLVIFILVSPWAILTFQWTMYTVRYMLLSIWFWYLSTVVDVEWKKLFWYFKFNNNYYNYNLYLLDFLFVFTTVACYTWLSCQQDYLFWWFGCGVAGCWWSCKGTSFCQKVVWCTSSHCG